MSMVQSGAVRVGVGRVPATAQQRRAALLCIVLAAAMLVTGVLGIGAFHPYQVGLDFAAVVALPACAWVLMRSGLRWPAATATWLSVIGVIAELGDHQARKNYTGALGASNTTYFLPWLLWLYMALLIVLALLVNRWAARPKGLD